MRARSTILRFVLLTFVSVLVTQAWGVTPASAVQAGADPRRVASEAARPPAQPGSETRDESASDPRSLARLRGRIEERWRIVVVRDGLVLVPRRPRADVRGLELTRDEILMDGHPVTGAELRARLGGDADVILALSYLDPQDRRAMFEPPATPGAPMAAARSPAPESTVSTGVTVRQRGVRFRLGQDLLVGEQERVEDAVAVLGSVTVDGEVAGDAVAVGGQVRLGPKAVVRGDVTAVGGRVDVHPDARVMGGVNEVAIVWPGHWGIPADAGITVGPWPGRDWWSSVAFGFTAFRLGLAFLLGLIAVLVGGRVYERTSVQATTAPWQATVLGIGAQVVAAPLLVVVCAALLISIIGIPLLALVPVGLIVIAAAWVLGFAVVAERIGQRVLRMESAPPALAFVVGFVLVTVLVLFSRAAWWAGWIGGGTAFVVGSIGTLIEGVVWAAGLGAVILAWLRRAGRPVTVTPPALQRTVDGVSVP